MTDGDGHAPARTGREGPVAGVARDDGATVVRLTGELDLYNAQALRKTLLACCAERPERLIVDLSDVEFVDSTTLGVLVEACTHLEDRRGFLLAAPGVEARRALETSGLDRHFAVHDTLAAARTASL